jgi:hypothetical protein
MAFQLRFIVIPHAMWDNKLVQIEGVVALLEVQFRTKDLRLIFTGGTRMSWVGFGPVYLTRLCSRKVMWKTSVCNNTERFGAIIVFCRHRRSQKQARYFRSE